MALSELLVEVKELAELDPDGLRGDELSELIVALHQVRTMLEAHHARVAAAWDAQRVWAADGARNGAVWMARHTQAPKSDYGGLLWLARQRRRFPLVYAAWEAGEITRAHVSRLVRAWSPRVDAEFCRDEALLVHHARTLRYDDFDQAVSYWSLRADPDGASETNEERRARRRVSLDETLNHTWSGSVLLDPVSGAVVATELRRLEQHLFDADWADAKRRLQRDPHSYELTRTPDQRRADALVEMARRSAGAQPDATARPLFTVLLGAETFRWLCELANDGTVVTPDQLRLGRRRPPRSAPVRRPRPAGHQGVTGSHLHRRPPPHPRRPRPPLLPPHLRRTRRRLPRRPHPPLVQRRAHQPRQRPPRLRPPQPPQERATTSGTGRPATRPAR